MSLLLFVLEGCTFQKKGSHLEKNITIFSVGIFSPEVGFLLSKSNHWFPDAQPTGVEFLIVFSLHLVYWKDLVAQNFSLMYPPRLNNIYIVYTKKCIYIYTYIFCGVLIDIHTHTFSAHLDFCLFLCEKKNGSELGWERISFTRTMVQCWPCALRWG